MPPSDAAQTTSSKTLSYTGEPDNALICINVVGTNISVKVPTPRPHPGSEEPFKSLLNFYYRRNAFGASVSNREQEHHAPKVVFD
jgi:hypothetical protein